MLNPFKIKKWVALILAGMIPTVLFTIVSMIQDFLWGIIVWILAVIFMVLIGFKLLNNPFSDLLEGKGLLAVNMDSKGLLQFFIVGVGEGVLRSNFQGKNIGGVFDRDNVANFSVPVKTESKVQRTEDGGLKWEISGDELNDTRFAFNQYPLLIWNDMSGTFISKSELGKFEREIISYDKVSFLAKKAERLSDAMLNFGRHLVDQLKPKPGMFGAMPTWLVILLGVIIMAIVGVFLFKAMQGGGFGALGSAAGAAKGAVNPIQPI